MVEVSVEIPGYTVIHRVTIVTGNGVLQLRESGLANVPLSQGEVSELPHAYAVADSLILGVEALFKSISSLLVNKKDKLEREHILRRKNSVMLTDPAKDAETARGEAKGRYGCCA